ncbi:nicotinamide mononucleotide transporter [bacterium]|nr:nicotinamide mononucleotide transporter [bacterium]
MNIMEFTKKELSGWGKIERIIFPLEILLIILISIYMKDNKVALVSAVCGISYTILAGKGKISCYLFGLAGTFCYSFISFKNALYGNLALYALYYFPMQVLGIFKWKKHLKSDTQEIEKTKLSKKERIIYSLIAVLGSVILAYVLWKLNDQNPIIDAITSVFSIIGLILTVKRCIEQWYIWFVVNGLSMVMWIQAYLNGSNCFATILMWATYFVLSIYFLHAWNKEMRVCK